MADLLGNILRTTPPFRGKWRLQRLWERLLPNNERRLARLPEGSILEVDMDIPYERMVWLENEEWRELEFLQHQLHRNDTFVDVGANMGLWTLVAAKTVGPEGKVFSFEPNPMTFRKLVANVERNEKTAIVTAFQKAVSSINGSVSFSCKTQHNISEISDDPNAEHVVSVQAVSLDSVLQGATVAGIKLDTEGHELASLEGASRIIAESSPWLIVEFNTTLLASPILAEWPVYRHLERFGYKPFTYDSPHLVNQIDGSFSISGYCNILFQRNTLCAGS